MLRCPPPLQRKALTCVSYLRSTGTSSSSAATTAAHDALTVDIASKHTIKKNMKENTWGAFMIVTAAG